MAEDRKPWGEGIPTPGSDAAQAAGCKCPVLDNNRGRRAPWPPSGWYINESCPIHGQATDQGEQQ